MRKPLNSPSDTTPAPASSPLYNAGVTSDGSRLRLRTDVFLFGLASTAVVAGVVAALQSVELADRAALVAWGATVGLAVDDVDRFVERLRG